MASTTYVARTANGYDTRSSDTMAYTHALLTTDDDGTNEGALSWHKSEANAHSAMRTATKWNKGKMRVVPVEVHQGGKAAVERKLKAEATSTVSAAAKAPAKKVTAKAPAKKATKAAPAKKAAATKKAAKAPAKKAAAKTTGSLAKGTPVHPAAGWLDILADKGMSGAAAARDMGIAPMTLNRLLNGHGIPTANICVRFARVAGLDVQQVWGEVAAYELALAQAALKTAK
jgi:plasmid maintenance system antidote protein VapI